MWDGRVYASREEAASAQAAYESEGFETSMYEEEGRFLVYSRRVVGEAAETGSRESGSVGGP